MTNNVLDDFYNKLSEKITELNLENKPQNIFNADETGFMCNPGLQKVFCRKGSKNVLNLNVNNEKEMYSVMVSFNKHKVQYLN